MQKKRLYSWALYDWANSAFSTTVMAGFFPLFFKNYWSAGVDPVMTTARLGTAISVASFIMASLSPFLGALADLRGYKKTFVFVFMMMGALSCAWLSQIGEGQWYFAMLAYGLAMMGFNASSVFYDSLLPSVAKDKEMDFASSLGFSLGYLGGGILFAFNVLMYLKPEWFGLSNGVEGVKWSFMSVAIWWIVFSIPLFKNVPEPKTGVSKDSLGMATKKSLVTLATTLKELKNHRNLAIYLLAYWLYIDGVYTVMTMAVDFGVSLGFAASSLIVALLLTQFIGFPATLVFGRLTKKMGCRVPILICICVCSVTVILATQMNQDWHFYCLAAVIGLVQGGVQSLSRSLFGQMIAEEKSGEFFGLFNLVGKFASILGPLVVGLGALATGSNRFGMLGVLLLFALGGLLLWQVKEPQKNEPI